MKTNRYEPIRFQKRIGQVIAEINLAKAKLRVCESGFNEQTPYFAKIVGINTDKGVFGISSLRDREGKVYLPMGRTLNLMAMVDGVSYRFGAKMTNEQTCNGVHFLAFPEELNYLQRRAYYRVSVPEGIGNFSIDIGGLKPLLGDVQDISVNGLRITATADEQFDEDIGDKLTRCRLRLDSYEDIPITATIRFKKQKNRDRLVLGLEFDEISNVHRNVIERYISDRDRELRRRAVGM